MLGYKGPKLQNTPKGERFCIHSRGCLSMFQVQTKMKCNNVGFNLLKNLKNVCKISRFTDLLTFRFEK